MGLTRAELGAVGGVSAQTVARFEAGTTSPTLDFIHSLCAAGIDVGLVALGLATLALQHPGMPVAQSRQRGAAAVIAD
ncbi:helix-turn-helix transcriptional regulator (plasmid) [Xanthomonas citri pv. citri]|uniref:helix-turn-helix domain-containing protein n=1 Tax=Xanthomonas citri TaxID=346 RepID=UPI001934A9F0|nr:helix-turn-helix transcriptional regulator [Xanthomonas citri]QRD62693.1 helix-turn-helix transcriptional regulator [Xanthomonas citri pv. citri]QRD67228.1 helix-turn-helix transcriptional regulator [Xanthomonas citri pv. citri]QRD71727.1 helix-turn-helix transcriptional regulator [Xanthomonas citri pv. citri]